jgi:hypothetical protein
MTRWIAIRADMLEHESLAHGPYDRRSAWLWLLANAAWKARRINHKGKPLQLERGQVLAGRRHLAETWGWGEKQVRNFLEMLRDQKMIEGGQSNGHFANVITICNYDKYQSATERANQSEGQCGARAGPEQGQTLTKGTKDTSKDNLQPSYHYAARESDDERRIAFVDGRLTLCNGLRQTWLEQFGSDAERLDLALIEVAGRVQTASSRPLEAQVSSQLARIAADKRDRDKRYAEAAARNKAAEAAPRETAREAKMRRDRELLVQLGVLS